MSDEELRGGLRARGEEALGELAQALLENPVFNQALTTALGAGERAVNAQRSAMSAVGIPASSDIERLEQRLRSLSARLEAVEDSLDEAMDELAALRRRVDGIEQAATDEAPAAPAAPQEAPAGAGED